MYEDKQRIARGAFAQVFTCQPPKFCADAPDLAVKITDLPTAGDNPVSQVHGHNLASFSFSKHVGVSIEPEAG